MEDRIYYHTRLIPREHLDLATPTAKVVVENKLCDTATPEIASILNDYGIDIVETRLIWWELEKEKGKFDFSRLEREIEQIKKAGMKIGLFPWLQHPPKWVLEDKSYTRLKCVEHNEESTLISLWDEKLLEEYDRLYKIVADRFKDEIDYFYVSVYGDYGELFFPNGVEHYLFSPEHNHTGIWSGDKKARKSYSEFLQRKYETEQELNNAWETSGVTFETAMYFNPDDNFRKKYDFQVWYTESMRDFADKVCSIIKKHFPDIKTALPIGHRHEPLEIGQIKSISAKIAAKHNMTARWTGWADFGTFEMSNVCARRIASAAKFYKTDYAVEAALYLDKENAIHALFEALSNSAGMMHNDPGNIIRGIDTYTMFKDVEKSPVYECNKAVFYPIEGEQCGILDMESYYHDIAVLRRNFDYEIVDSYMIKDGFLDNVDTLIFNENTPVLQETADVIAEYVKENKIKLLCTGVQMPYIVDGTGIIECEIIDENILNNTVRCYKTDFKDYSLIFDAEKGTITEMEKEEKR